jgi:sugar phosphate isomerase/epimerase
MAGLTPIAVQLYTLRDRLAGDFEGVIAHLRDTGYAGVEPFANMGVASDVAAQIIQNAGLEIAAFHAPLPLGDNARIAVEMAETYACRRLAPSLGTDHYATLDAVYRTCDRINEAAQTAAQHDLALGYHNHWWEFEPVEGQIPFDILRERVDPAVFFEIDVYWVQVGGADPVQVVGDVGPRAPLLHIKDGPATSHEEPMVAVGSGVIDIPGVVNAARPHAEWLIVELDRCATDMLDAVDQSYRYLTGEGLGRGRTA